MPKVTKKSRRPAKRIPTPLEGARHDLNRAKRYIADYKRREESFIKKKFYSTVIEMDAEGVNELHKFVISRYPTRNMTDAAFDAIDKLRGALDKLMHAVGVATIKANLGLPKLTKLHFPVGDTPADYDNAIKSMCSALPPEIVSLLRTFKVHEGADANEIVWALNRARRQGYHRAILPIGVIGDIKPGLAGSKGKLPSYIPRPAWDSTKDEVVFHVVGPEGAFGYSFDYSFSIQFGDSVEGVCGLSVRNFLEVALVWAERFFAEIEAASRSIGLAL